MTPDPKGSAMTDQSGGLLACPFCGGEPKRLTIGEDEPNNAGGDVIVCTRCQASSHVEFGRKENLVSRWNARHTHPAATGSVREDFPAGAIENGREFLRRLGEYDCQAGAIAMSVDYMEAVRCFEWLVMSCQRYDAALAAAPTPDAAASRQSDGDPDGWLAVKVNGEGGIVMPYGPLHPGPDRPADPRYQWAPFYLGEPA